MNISKSKGITTSEFDEMFDSGDVVEHLDKKSIKLKNPIRRISIDFPETILDEVDFKAAKIGVTRTALIKMWVAHQLSKQSPCNLFD